MKRVAENNFGLKKLAFIFRCDYNKRTYKKSVGELQKNDLYLSRQSANRQNDKVNATMKYAFSLSN